jgi:hypothetical protein
MQTRAQMKAGHSRIESIVDPKLEGNYPWELFVSLVDLGLKCASFKRNIWPTMKVSPSVTQFFPSWQQMNKDLCIMHVGEACNSNFLGLD